MNLNKHENKVAVFAVGVIVMNVFLDPFINKAWEPGQLHRTHDEYMRTGLVKKDGCIYKSDHKKRYHTAGTSVISVQKSKLQQILSLAYNVNLWKFSFFNSCSLF